MKLSEKFADEGVINVLDQVIDRMIEISEQLDAKLVLKQCQSEIIAISKIE